MTTQTTAGISFHFVGIDDTGPESGACCPHCGAQGRYIYNWEENVPCSGCGDREKSTFSDPCRVKEFILEYYKKQKQDKWE